MPTLAKTASLGAPALIFEEELRSLATGFLTDLVDRTLDRAVDLLLNQGLTERSGVRKRVLFDASRIIKRERQTIGMRLMERVNARFRLAPGRLQGATAALCIEDRSAIASAISELEASCVDVVAEIETLLKRIESSSGTALQVEPLLPQALVRTVDEILVGMNVEPAVNDEITGLFARLAAPNLASFYQGILQLLRSAAVTQERPVAKLRLSTERSPLVLGPSAAAPGFGNLPPVSRSAMAAVRSALNEPAPVEGPLPAHPMFAASPFKVIDSLLGERLVAAPVRERLRRIRLALPAYAARVPSLVTDRSHPLQDLLEDLPYGAALAVNDAIAQQRVAQHLLLIERELKRVLSSTPSNSPTTATAAGAAAAAPTTSAPSAPATAAAKREAVMERAKAVVAGYLNKRLVGRLLPEPVKTLLEVGWAPMMALRLVSTGMNSPAWSNGFLLLNRILHAADPRDAAPNRADDNDSLMRDLQQELVASGLPELRRRALLEPMAAALRAKQPAERTAGPGLGDTRGGVVGDSLMHQVRHLLRQIAAPGVWFRLNDKRGDGSRWLRVVSYDSQFELVEFNDFTGGSRTVLRADFLLRDLLRGHAEPLEASASASQALQMLRSMSSQIDRTLSAGR